MNRAGSWLDVGGYLDLCAQAAVAARARGRPTLVAWRQEISPLDPAELLGTVFGRVPRAFFWSSPRDGLSFIAAGSAWDLSGQGTHRFRAVRHRWRQALADTVAGGTTPVGPVPALVGGFAFEAGAGDPHGSFPDALMWLPSVLVARDRTGVCTLTLHKRVRPTGYRAAAGSVARMAAVMLATRDRPAARIAGVGAVTSTSAPTEEQWQQLVAETVTRIRRGEFTKAVLSRQLRLRSTAPFDVPETLRALLDRNPSTTVFGCRIDGKSFLGATPEQLVRVHGAQVTTMSLAGSIARSRHPDEDRYLAETLYRDPKCRHEQDIVTAMLRNALTESCTGVRVPSDPEVLALPDVQHLYSRVTATLRDPARSGALELAERLHPTPAVGGHPRAVALRWIRHGEALDRGWYAGPVGWLGGEHDGDFAVAIRSALVAGRAATLYAGCGIVADSDPADELAETHLKLRPMLAALGVSPTRAQAPVAAVAP